MKNSLLTVIAGLGVLSQLSADECKTCFEPNYLAGEALDPCCITVGYPYPATTELCSWDFYVDGTWIYWTLGNSTSDSWGTRTTLTGSPILIDEITFDEKYHSGFRVGAGADLGPVVLDLKYTYLYRNFEQNYTAGSNDVLKSNTPSVATALLSSINIKDTNNLNFLDLSLIKPIYISERMTLDLGYGLLGAWHHKHRHMAAVQTNLIPGTIDCQDKCWSIGPEVNIRGKGLLCWGFYVLGSFEGTLQYGKYTTNKTDIYFSNLANISANASFNNKNMYYLYPLVESQIGLGWAMYFCDDWRVDFNGTYDVMFMSPGPNNINGGVGQQPIRAPIIDLTGFTLSGRIDF
jgi:hypothetical protein